MKVSAITALRFASPVNVTIAPTGATLVILHIRENVVINGASLVEIRRPPCRHFDRQLSNAPVKRDEMVRPKPALYIRQRHGVAGSRNLREIVAYVFASPDGEIHGNRNRPHDRIFHLDVHDLIPMLGVGEDFRGIGRRHVGFQDFLIIITLRIWQPDFYLLRTRGNVVDFCRVRHIKGSFFERRSRRY